MCVEFQKKVLATVVVVVAVGKLVLVVEATVGMVEEVAGAVVPVEEQAADTVAVKPTCTAASCKDL